MTPLRARELPWSWLNAWLDAIGRPKPQHPRVDIDLRPSVPAWALRVACAVAATCCSLLVASNGFQWVIAGAIILTMTARPAGFAPSIFVVGAGLLVLTSEADPFDPRVFLLAFGLHLTIELAAVVGDLPWGAPVELRVLAEFVAPFLAIQVLVQTVALMGAWATAGELSAPWLPVGAGVALAGMAWAILSRLRLDG